MKRNMDLIKEIMLKVEEESSVYKINGYSKEEINYHTKLLIDSEFIEGKYHYNRQTAKRFVDRVIIHDVTMSGYDFLDILNDDNKFKIIKDLGKNLSMEAIKISMKQAIVTMMG